VHAIVYAEIDTWLKRVRETPRKEMKYKEANLDQIKKDLENTLTTINNIYEKSDTNILWNTFKNDIINSIESNIPHKLFTYKQRLTFFFQWAYARVVLSNAFEVAKKLFWFIIRVLMLIGVFNG
jgi:hypothetical protein